MLGRLLRNRHADAARAAWNQPNLAGPDALAVTSAAFADGAAMPREHANKRVGGADVSPPLAWTPAPDGTLMQLLVVEDVDVPLKTPAIHCLALLDASVTELPAGALASRSAHPGVRLLRPTIGRGYVGPAPIPGHGPHRYVFELYALGDPVALPAGIERMRPWRALRRITGPVLARGRLTGTYER